MSQQKIGDVSFVSQYFQYIDHLTLLLIFVWTSSKLGFVFSVPSCFTSTFDFVLLRFTSCLIKNMELESTFPLQQIRSLIRRASKSSHESRSPFRNHPSLPAEQDKIRLRLTTWAGVLAEPTNTDDLVRNRIEKIFAF